MSERLGVMIAQSLSFSLGYTERLLKEVTDESARRLASPGGVPVNSNHPAFILGHLSLYAPRIVTQLGHDAAPITVPEIYTEVFSHSATCQDDPEGTLYPPFDDIRQTYFAGYRFAIEKLQTAEDEIFQTQNPTEGRVRELFPTLGAAHMFYVGGHMLVHLGQLSAWRRMQGWGAA